MRDFIGVGSYEIQVFRPWNLMGGWMQDGVLYLVDVYTAVNCRDW